MREVITFSLLILISFCLSAQEFDVREFKAVPNDISARRYEKKTVNDESAAIIKIVTNIPGMQFETGLGIVDFERKDDGYWVWVPPRERRIFAPGSVLARTRQRQYGLSAYRGK